MKLNLSYGNLRQNSQFDPSTFVLGSNSSLNYKIDRFHPQTFYLSSISTLVLCGMPSQQLVSKSETIDINKLIYL